MKRRVLELPVFRVEAAPNGYEKSRSTGKPQYFRKESLPDKFAVPLQKWKISSFL